MMAGLMLAGCEATLRETESEPEPEPETVSYSACIQVGGTSGGTVDGVTWAVYGRPEIAEVVTDSIGCFTLEGLPPDTDLLLTWTKDGMDPRLRTLHTGTTDFLYEGPEYVVEASLGDEFEAWAGFEGVDDWLGQISLLVLDGTLPLGKLSYGAGFTIDTTPRLELECILPPGWTHQGFETEGCGADGLSEGGYTACNVDEPYVDVTVGPPDHTCTAQVSEDGWALAWPVPGQTNTFRIPTRPGYETFSTVACSPPGAP